MIYRIKEKFWAWGDDFAITDRDGNTKFQVDGHAFSWGDKLSFQDPDGNELAFISQKLWTWMPKYEILIDGEVYAEVVKEWTWFNKEFTLDVPGPNDYKITGSFWLHEYHFERNGRTAARISKEWFSWTDSYGVEIYDNENEIAILCTCIVIDQILHDDDEKK